MSIDVIVGKDQNCLWKNVVNGKYNDTKYEIIFNTIFGDVETYCKNCNGYKEKCMYYSEDKK